MTLSTVDRKIGAKSLLVLLPGAYMRAADFVEQGCFAAVAEAGLELDLCAVDLELDAISGGQALPAVAEQILAPARVHYEKVWLGGISLGGLLTLCQTADHPDSVDGLCLIAPYPGSRLTTNAIARAGGLAAWTPTSEQWSDPEFRAWHWLKAPPPTLPVFVGYGTEDRFAEGMAQIAGCFPANARHPVAGGHDWAAWQRLWQDFVAAGHFPRHTNA